MKARLYLLTPALGEPGLVLVRPTKRQDYPSIARAKDAFRYLFLGGGCEHALILAADGSRLEWPPGARAFRRLAALPRSYHFRTYVSVRVLFSGVIAPTTRIQFFAPDPGASRGLEWA